MGTRQTANGTNSAAVCALLGCLVAAEQFGPPPAGTESLMTTKPHTGSCSGPIQPVLRWGCTTELADSIGCHNRDFAEHWGYWTQETSFLDEANALPADHTITFYDSVSGLPLF